MGSLRCRRCFYGFCGTPRLARRCRLGSPRVGAASGISGCRIARSAIFVFWIRRPALSAGTETQRSRTVGGTVARGRNDARHRVIFNSRAGLRGRPGPFPGAERGPDAGPAILYLADARHPKRRIAGLCTGTVCGQRVLCRVDKIFGAAHLQHLGSTSAARLGIANSPGRRAIRRASLVAGAASPSGATRANATRAIRPSRQPATYRPAALGEQAAPGAPRLSREVWFRPDRPPWSWSSAAPPRSFSPVAADCCCLCNRIASPPPLIGRLQFSFLSPRLLGQRTFLSRSRTATRGGRRKRPWA
jgi:hypothetical protein